MKRYFLVDLENVGKTFLKGIDKLTSDDVIIICHNKALRAEFSPAIIEGLSTTKALIKKFYITSAVKNAMDFELVMELGFLIAENGNHAQYFIVSNDRGFDIVNDYLLNKGLKTQVRRIPTMEANFEEEERISTMEEELEALLPEFPRKVTRIVQQGIDTSKSKEQLHNFLQSHLWRDFAVIYPRVKHYMPQAQKV